MPNTIQTKYINNVNMLIDGQSAYHLLNKEENIIKGE